jgi:hypothetical protein
MNAESSTPTFFPLFTFGWISTATFQASSQSPRNYRRMSIEEIPIIKKRPRPQPRVRELSIEGDDTEVAEINEDEAKLL